MPRFPALLLIGVLAGSLPALAAEPVAERLYMKNGDRLSGTGHTTSDGNLEFELPYGDRIAVPLSEIDRREALVEETTVSPASPTATDPAASPDMQVQHDEHQFYAHGTVFPMLDRFGDRVHERVRDWTKKIGLGGRYSDGNSHLQSADLSAEFERRTSRHFSQITIAGQYGQANGVRGTNRWIGNSTTDVSARGDWIYFAKVMDEYDEFQNLDYRGSFATGMGYRFYDEDKYRMIARFGPAVTGEVFHKPVTRRVTPGVFGEIEVRWPLSERVRLEQKTTFLPSVSQIEMLRANNNTGILFALDAEERWNLKFDFQYQFIGRPNPGRQPADYWANMLIVYQRK